MLRRSRLSLGFLALLGAVSVLALSCTSSKGHEVADSGTLRVALTAVGASGTHYRLRNGTFNIAGASTRTVNTETNPNAESIDVDLTPGDYSILLGDGWFLEQGVADGTFDRVKAKLTSANPQTFQIVARETMNVGYRFQVHGEVVEIGGSLSIGIDVEEPDGGAPRGWSTATPIDGTASGNATGPSLALNGAGMGFVVFNETDGGSTVWTRRYTTSGGWEDPTQLSSAAARSASGGAVAVNAGGNAIAWWSETDASGQNALWARRYSVNGGWGDATTISSGVTAFDDAGDAFAVWHASDHTSIWGSASKPDGHWTAPAMLTTVGSDTPYYEASTTVDGLGHLILVSNQSGTVWATRYDVDTGWEAIQTLDGNAWDPSLAVDASGDAIVAWSKQENGIMDVWTSRATALANWEAPTLVYANPPHLADPTKISMDAQGNALVVWVQEDTGIGVSRYAAGQWSAADLSSGVMWNPQLPAYAPYGANGAVAAWLKPSADGSQIELWTKRYEVGAGWSEASLVQPGIINRSMFVPGPGLAVNGSGDAFVTWTDQAQGGQDTWIRYIGPRSWSTPLKADGAALAVDADGNAVLVWQQTDGTRDRVWAQLYQ